MVRDGAGPGREGWHTHNLFPLLLLYFYFPLLISGSGFPIMPSGISSTLFSIQPEASHPGLFFSPRRLTKRSFFFILLPGSKPDREK